MERAIKIGHPIFFGSLVVFSIVLMSLCAFLVDRFNQNDNAPTNVCSLWTIVTSSLYLVGFLVVPLGSGGALLSVASHLIWVVLSFCIWLAGAAAITAELGGGLSCKLSDFVYCHHHDAILGLTWIDTVLVFLMLIVVIIIAVKARSTGGRMGSSAV